MSRGSNVVVRGARREGNISPGDFGLRDDAEQNVDAANHDFGIPFVSSSSDLLNLDQDSGLGSIGNTSDTPDIHTD